jgi:hypothetical protein
MNKQLLDPIGTMCKLIGLIFHKANTKIKITNHVLTLDKPDDLQFLHRWWDQANKENISELYYVIVRIITWYLIPEEQNKVLEKEKKEEDENLNKENLNKENVNNNNLSNNQDFRKMIGYLCDSLIKLQNTYNSGNVVIALQFYINILQMALVGKFDVNILPKCLVKKDKETVNLLDYEKIKSLWDNVKIKKVCDLYDKCFVLITSDDLPEDTKEILINSYLKLISETLAITDGEFQGLVSNSNKG